MSVDHIDRHAWVASLALSGVEKAVLRVLADYANSETLKCWPSVPTIFKKSGFCKNTVLRAIRSLASKKVIDVEYSPGGNPNMYVLSIANSSRDEPFKKSNSSRDERKRSTRCTVNGSRDEPEPVIEPVKNQVTFDRSAARSTLPFEVFYKAYPRHVARKKAQEIWKRKKLDDKLHVILADVEKRTANGCWAEARYIPYPATYLNQERWDDEDDPPPARPPIRHAGVVV